MLRLACVDAHREHRLNLAGTFHSAQQIFGRVMIYGRTIHARGTMPVNDKIPRRSTPFFSSLYNLVEVPEMKVPQPGGDRGGRQSFGYALKNEEVTEIIENQRMLPPTAFFTECQ